MILILVKRLRKCMELCRIRRVEGKGEYTYANT